MGFATDQRQFRLVYRSLFAGGNRLFLLVILLLLAELPRQIHCGGRRVKMPNKNFDRQYRSYVRAPLSNPGQISWHYGTATFYDLHGNSGACGFPNSHVQNNHFAAVPNPRWSDTLSKTRKLFSGAVCGQCFQIQCLDVPIYDQRVFCHRNRRSITVRITDTDVFHPSAPTPPNRFDLGRKSFAAIARLEAGILNIRWKRVPCDQKSVAKWTRWRGSNPYWHDLVLYDLPGPGNIASVHVKPAGRKNWIRAKHLWGAHYALLVFARIDGSTKVAINRNARGRTTVIAQYAQTSD